VLPRGKVSSDDDEGDGPGGDSAPLSAYMKDPTPGVALVFEASRFDFEGEEKRKQDRVRKFYSAIPDVIELRRYASHEARRETEALASRAGFRLDDAALDLLVEALGADIARIAVEIEKLSLFAGNRTVTIEDISALVPDARATTIFALVNAVARRDRVRALEFLDTLTRDGEYLPLALAFLSTQFRMALVAREAGLKSGSQVQSHFTKMGVPMWGSRADQVYQTAAKFSQAQLERAMKSIFDRGSGPARRAPRRPHHHGAIHPPDGGPVGPASWPVADARPVPHSPLSRKRLHAASQLRLVPRRRILLDDPVLRRTVDNRKSLRQHLGGRFGILAGKDAADLANRVTQAGLILPVEFRAPFGLTHPLECGNCIGHLC
jgi:DNA polymerase III delta subunit